MDPISLVIRMLVRLLVVVLVVVIRWVLKYLWVRLVPYVRGFLAITGFYVAAVVVLALVLGVLLILAWRREGRKGAGRPGSGSGRGRRAAGGAER